MEKKADIVQSNDLVRSFPHIDNDITLSVVQKRILFFLITKIREEDSHPKGDNWIRVKTNDMIKDVFTSRGGKEAKDALSALDELRDKKYDLLIRYRDKEGVLMERLTKWILEIDRPVVASGYLDVSMPDLILDHVRNQESLFTLLDMPTAKRLKSYAQLKLWELLTSHASLGSWEVSIKDLKRLLEIKDDSYKRPSDFRKHVLSKSVDAINKETRLSVQFEIIRDKTGVHFTISQEKKNLSTYSPELQAELKARGVQHLKKWEAEGVTPTHWKKALEMDLEPAHLVIEAKKHRDQDKAGEEKAKAKLTQAERMKKNREWFLSHKDEFPDNTYEDGITVFVGGSRGINYASEDFFAQIKK